MKQRKLVLSIALKNVRQFNQFVELHNEVIA